MKLRVNISAPAKPSNDGASRMKIANSKGYFKKIKENSFKSPTVNLFKNKERHFHYVLIFFKPWRSEERDLMNSSNPYKKLLFSLIFCILRYSFFIYSNTYYVNENRYLNCKWKRKKLNRTV